MGHSHKRQIETRLTVVSTLIYQARKPPWGQASCGSTRLRDVWWFASTGAWVCLSLCVCVWLLLLKDMHLYTGAVSHVKPLAWTLIVRWKKLSSSILTRVLTHSNILTRPTQKKDIPITIFLLASVEPFHFRRNMSHTRYSIEYTGISMWYADHRLQCWDTLQGLC